MSFRLQLTDMEYSTQLLLMVSCSSSRKLIIVFMFTFYTNIIGFYHKYKKPETVTAKGGSNDADWLYFIRFCFSLRFVWWGAVFQFLLACQLVYE